MPENDEPINHVLLITDGSSLPDRVQIQILGSRSGNGQVVANQMIPVWLTTDKFTIP